MLEMTKYLTVGDLKKILSKIDNSLFVGRVGHYGEFNEMDESDFWVTDSYITDSVFFTTKNKAKRLQVLHISPPYIGEEPD